MSDLRAVPIDILRKARILVAKPDHPGSGVPALRREVLAGLDKAISGAAPQLAGPLPAHSSHPPHSASDTDNITLGFLIDNVLSIMVICSRCRKPHNMDPEVWAKAKKYSRNTRLGRLREALYCDACRRAGLPKSVLVLPGAKYDAEGHMLTDLALFTRGQELRELF
ncbi:hypothetical protein HH303_18555 [Rhodospirillaceae bacterium KN72]|uniref:Uncharacterized protein n=1 Tax=Pacificispira spongiicola TaxID=2729598 RepID=A0A7Y0E3F2_9PROT|nr:hypothetical protein [Pacificispira spongiicola]NMM46499.1 hypothetical protein [Pacificispira spongiicola]